MFSDRGFKFVCHIIDEINSDFGNPLLPDNGEQDEGKAEDYDQQEDG
jgi:hypothetical protein